VTINRDINARQLRYEMWELQPTQVKPDLQWYRCDRCRSLTLYNLRGVGWSPASQTGAKQMSRKDAHAFAASLAATLMVSIVVFQAGDGSFGAVPPMKSTETRFK